ncbi:sulfite exporter TauE/SafE family protein [Rickettsiales bacterium]|nr:sulfite exporter TauE/SafE family protein [Rickettsiales bacterium]MDB2550631.1 sulfite exporter TauE/SafE family protein [Rickettsiales bacterium]
MQIYLPIAEIPINILWIISLGFITGILSGMFGIGGGFIATPMLIFMGIPPLVAVATSANQITASSISGLLSHTKQKNVDFKMGFTLIFGGIFGSIIGIIIFRMLQDMGQADVFISIIYVIFLGFIGITMVIDNLRTILKEKYEIETRNKRKQRKLFIKFSKRLNKLPFKVYFPKSDVELSLIIPISIGVFAGSLVSMMGIGGGFVVVPAMIYILKMPHRVITGTSLFQIVFIAVGVTVMQSVVNNTVDIVLAAIMIIGSVIGVQFGIKKAKNMDSDSLKLLLAIMILLVCFKMFSQLFLEPTSLYNIEIIK